MFAPKLLLLIATVLFFSLSAHTAQQPQTAAIAGLDERRKVSHDKKSVYYYLLLEKHILGNPGLYQKARQRLANLHTQYKAAGKIKTLVSTELHCSDSQGRCQEELDTLTLWLKAECKRHNYNYIGFLDEVINTEIDDLLMSDTAKLIAQQYLHMFIAWTHCYRDTFIGTHTNHDKFIIDGTKRELLYGSPIAKK